MDCPIGLDNCTTCYFVLSNGGCNFKTFRDKKQEEDLKAKRQAYRIKEL